MRVSAQRGSESGIGSEDPHEISRSYADYVPPNLHQGGHWTIVGTEKKRQSEQAFVTDHRDLNCLAVAAHGYGDESVAREYGVTEGLVMSVKDLTSLDLKRFRDIIQKLLTGLRQSG